MTDSVLLGDVRYGLTRWFADASPPMRIGVYEREQPSGRYACWDGHAWRSDSPTPVAAALAEHRVAPRRRGRWRGLVEASDAPCATCRGHGVVDAGITEDGAGDLISECLDC